MKRRGQPGKICSRTFCIEEASAKALGQEGGWHVSGTTGRRMVVAVGQGRMVCRGGPQEFAGADRGHLVDGAAIPLHKHNSATFLSL